MGTSTDAILFFGFDFHDQDSDDESLDFDPSNWQKVYTERTGKDYKTSGVSIDSHCHGDYPIWFMYINGMCYRAYRGNSQSLDLKVIDLRHTDDITKLKDFCKVMNITYEEPGWVLASYWG